MSFARAAGRAVACSSVAFVLGGCLLLTSLDGLAGGTGGDGSDGGEAGAGPADAALDADGHRDAEASVDAGCRADLLPTDAENCGRCGHSCLGSTCAAGRCVPVRLAVGAPAPQEDVAVDGTYVYWTTPTQIERVPLDGGTTSFVAIAQGAPAHLARAGAALYWTNYFDAVASVVSSPMPAASSATHTAVVSGQGGCSNLRLTADRLYWANNPLSSAASLNVALLDAPDGGPVTTFATGPKGFLGLGVDAANVYWTDGVAMAVMKKSHADSTVQVLVANQQNPGDLIADASGLYWVTLNQTGALMHAGADGSNVTALLTGQGRPIELALDATRVYFTDGSANTVVAVTKDGSSTTVLATSQSSPSGITVDDSFVYWVNAGDGSVFKVAK